MPQPWSGANTVAQLLDMRAAGTPLAIAFRTETIDGRWEPVTWQDFAAAVAKLRRALFAAGLRKGDRFALIAPVSLEWELLHHAALALGVVVVGLDAHDLAERIASMVEQAAIAAFAVADVRVLANLGPDRLAACRFVLRLGRVPADDGLWPAGARRLTWDELGALGEVADAALPELAAADTATLIFTSGTTGAARGIAFTHGQVCLAVDAIVEAFSFVGHDGRLLCWLPLSNLFQRMVNLAGVRKGVATYLLADPRRVMLVVAAVAPDIFVGVPRFFEKLYDGIREKIAAQAPPMRWLIDCAWEIGRRASRYRTAGRSMPAWLVLLHALADRLVLTRIRSVMGERLQCMVTGSAPTPQHLLEELHALGWLVLEAYGMSENVLPMAMNRIDDFRLGSVGRPLPGNQIVVGEDGAIKVRGPGMFAGYLGDPDQPVLDAAGFYATGDLGRFDADGFLYLTGRSSEMIKTSTGRRVAPAGVEAMLREVPGIDQAVLIGNGRKCLVALCTCAPGLVETAKARLKLELRGQMARIGEHERPLGIALISQPFSIAMGELTPNLKLRRAAIEARHADLIRKLYEEIDRGATSASDQALVI